MSARKWRIWPWLLGLLVLGSFGLAISRVAQRGRFSSAYSSYGAGPDGTRALFRLTEQLGYRALRLDRELSHLGPGTLIAIGGCRGGLVRPLLRPEHEELKRWVEAGGLLIAAGVDAHVPDGVGLSLAARATCDSPEQGLLDKVLEPPSLGAGERVPASLQAVPAGPPLVHTLPFLADRARTVQVSAGNEATVLLSSEHGPLALTAPLGRGRVVLLGTPEALTNRGLEQGGSVLIARLLAAFAPPATKRGERQVWFDEYHLGLGERRSLIRYMRDRGYGALLVQGVVALLVALLARAVRVGRARDEPVPPVRASRHYLSALSALYERGGDSRGALEVLARHALQRVARRYRASGTALDELPRWLKAAGFEAAGALAQRIVEHGSRPLERGESLLGRARQIEQDENFAMALGDPS